MYLLPLSFLGNIPIKTNLITSDEKQLIQFLDRRIKAFPYNNTQKTHYAFQINISLSKRSKSSAGLYLSNDPNAPKVFLSEDQLMDKYPMSYSQLTEACEKRYENFKIDRSFYNLKSNYENNPKFCYSRSLNLDGGGNKKNITVLPC
jgi:hypothetical protein